LANLEEAGDYHKQYDLVPKLLLGNLRFIAKLLLRHLLNPRSQVVLRNVIVFKAALGHL
jgi:hypothetical protein